MSHRRYLTAALVCLPIALLYLATNACSYVGEVVVANKGTEIIQDGELEICGQKFDVGQLRQGESKLFVYKVRSDSHFNIKVKFASGKILSKELGYVTSGRDSKHILTITENEAAIELQ